MPLRKVAHGLSLCLPIFVASATRDAKISLDLTEIARVETPVKPVAVTEVDDKEHIHTASLSQT